MPAYMETMSELLTMNNNGCPSNDPYTSMEESENTFLSGHRGWFKTFSLPPPPSLDSRNFLCGSGLYILWNELIRILSSFIYIALLHLLSQCLFL